MKNVLVYSTSYSGLKSHYQDCQLYVLWLDKILQDSNIEIQSDSVFGNFKDNRPYAAGVDKNSKLIIKAECVFGGGEIR